MDKTVETNHYGEVKLSGSENDIIELIKKLRNDHIKDFLDERYLKEYVNRKYHVTEVSNVKLQFIKKELKELFESPLNTDHYLPLIKEIQDNDRTSLAEGNDALFYRELESIFLKYIF